MSVSRMNLEECKQSFEVESNNQQSVLFSYIEDNRIQAFRDHLRDSTVDYLEYNCKGV